MSYPIKRVTKYALSFLIVVLSHTVIAADISTDDNAGVEKQAISRLITTLNEDWNRGDMAAYLNAYWQDERFILVSGNNVRTGWKTMSDLFYKAYPNPVKMGKFYVKSLSIKMLTPNLALASGRWEHQFVDERVEGAFTHIVQLFDQQGWKIIHEHTSRAQNNKE